MNNYEENYIRFYHLYNNLKNDYEFICTYPPSISRDEERFLRFYYNSENKKEAAKIRYNQIFINYYCDENFKHQISVIIDDLQVLLNEVNDYFMLFRNEHKSAYGSLFSAINKKLNKNYNITRQKFTNLIDFIKKLMEIIKKTCDNVEYVTDLEIKGGKSKKEK
jgi:hypothetical protein